MVNGDLTIVAGSDQFTLKPYMVQAVLHTEIEQRLEFLRVCYMYVCLLSHRALRII